MKRRELLKSLTAGTVAGTLASQAMAGTRSKYPAMKTYVYKKVAGCEIKADVYGGGASADRKPVVVAIHGGALIMGTRASIRTDLLNPLIDRGFVVVSIDYRVAPETRLPEIIEDLRDAFDWIRREGPKRFGADPERIGVHGESAGGYLTLMSGFCVQPRPLALVSFYGYGDIIGDWYTRPDPFYNSQPPVTEEQARAVIEDHAIAEQIDGKDRTPFYIYCRQNGLWPEKVAGFDPRNQARAFEPYCPLRNVTPDYPPTLLGHGTRDHDVPYEQSVLMAAEFARVGVPHEFIPLQNADHGFAGAGPKLLRNVIRRSAEFFAHYVSKP